jgi:hypothetical protein
VERSLFANRGFPAALVTSTLLFATTTELTLAVVLAAQLGAVASALDAGLTLLPGRRQSRRRLWRRAPRWCRGGGRVMPTGLAVVLVGALAAVPAYQGKDRVALLVALAVAAAAQGLFPVPFFGTALARVRPSETGSAAGLLNAVSQLGGTLGTAVIGTVVLAAVTLAAFLTVAVLVLTGPACLVVVRRPARRAADLPLR